MEKIRVDDRVQLDYSGLFTTENLRECWMQPEESALVNEIKRLERTREAYRDLCGGMLATLLLPRNREELLSRKHPDSVAKLFEMADVWEQRFQAIK